MQDRVREADTTRAPSALRRLWQRFFPPAVPVAPQPRLEPVAHEITGHPVPDHLRSEDVRFSPSGRQIAVAATKNCVMLFDVDTSLRPLAVHYRTRLEGAELRSPHGVDWLDEEHLVVANRQAGLSVIRIPRQNKWGVKTAAQHVGTLQSRWFGAPGEQRNLRERKIVTGPGSVRVYGGTVLVSCNKANTVTAHKVTEGPDGPRIEEGELVAQNGIEVPDSAARSPDGNWLAVSDHDNHRVLVFRYGQDEPVASLTSPALKHPHGVVFHPSGRAILAADAGSPYLHCFTAPDGGWSRDATAAALTYQAVDQTLFDKVQSEEREAVRALEGGAKGIDVSKDGALVVTTCRGQTLAFFAYSPAA